MEVTEVVARDETKGGEERGKPPVGARRLLSAFLGKSFVVFLVSIERGLSFVAVPLFALQGMKNLNNITQLSRKDV